MSNISKNNYGGIPFVTDLISFCDSAYLPDSYIGQTINTISRTEPELVYMGRGVAVPLKLAELMDAIRSKLRGAKFKFAGAHNTYTRVHLGHYLVGETDVDGIETVVRFSNVLVYMDGYEYILGECGYRDVRADVSHGYQPKYYIRSPHIRNNKYHTSRWQYNSEASTNITTVLRKGIKNLRPLSHEDIAKYRLGELSGYTYETRMTPWREFSEARRRAVGDDRSCMQMLEFISQLIADDAYVPAQIVERIQSYLDAEKAYKEMKEVERKGAVITAQQRGSSVVYSVTPINNTMSDYPVREAVLSDTDGTLKVDRYMQDDLPEEIAGKLAMLSMTEPKQYIEGVGVKFTDSQCVIEFGYTS